ncbi:MAG: tRNA epoxyqueuosine(34) reductase QueG [Gammaproteobacteria bacterium]
MLLTKEYCEISSLTANIHSWAQELGFSALGVADLDLAEDAARFNTWLQKGYHGEMHYLEKHKDLRANPPLLLSDVKSVICCRLNYAPVESDYIASYAHDNDYHKVMRKKLLALARRIKSSVSFFQYRVFCDSAPVLEKALAVKAGLGWIGKNGLLISKDGGSFGFLGEIYCNLSLPIGEKISEQCGSCRRCLDACPTKALLKDRCLDARRCISYLTIEHKGSIPEDLRPLIGTRIFGCDACQLACSWNKDCKQSASNKTLLQERFQDLTLSKLFLLSKEEFLEKTTGTVLRRISYEQWLRNIAVALGNAPKNTENHKALLSRVDDASPLVGEHVRWALKLRSHA